CTGTSNACPTDTFKSSTVACTSGSQGGLCDNDASDHCSGTANTCVDVFQASTLTCRASTGTCDIAETCTGTNGSCPNDTNFTSSTVTCRASAGQCDVVENCTGTSNACPTDTFKSSTVACTGGSQGGLCDNDAS